MDILKEGEGKYAENRSPIASGPFVNEFFNSEVLNPAKASQIYHVILDYLEDILKVIFKLKFIVEGKWNRRNCVCFTSPFFIVFWV